MTYALVVDDNHNWQTILSEILTDSGLEVHTAATFEDAVRHLRTTPYRVAVVDLALAGSDHRNQDGLAVLDAVQQVAPACQTILVTGYATVEIAVNALTEHGAISCVHKDNFSRAEFEALISVALTNAPSGTGQLNAPPAPAEREQAGGRSALVVDDDAGWRSIISELLVEAGYSVHPCNSYGEALGVLGRETFHAAVVDLSLTGRQHGDDFEGFHLLERTNEAGIPSVVVSGVASVDLIDHIYTSFDVFAHLEKQTFDRGAFLRTIEELHEAELKATGLDDLTPREMETLELLTAGMTNKEIAEALMISTNTVKRHLKAIFTKLEVNTRTAAAAKAVAVGIVAEED